MNMVVRTPKQHSDTDGLIPVWKCYVNSASPGRSAPLFRSESLSPWIFCLRRIFVKKASAVIDYVCSKPTKNILPIFHGLDMSNVLSRAT
jgi:hypothetical protein